MKRLIYTITSSAKAHQVQLVDVRPKINLLVKGGGIHPTKLLDSGY